MTNERFADLEQKNAILETEIASLRADLGRLQARADNQEEILKAFAKLGKLLQGQLEQITAAVAILEGRPQRAPLN